MSMVSGVIDVEPIARALGRQRANILPALHAFSGADTVGKFNQLDKATWFKIFMKSGSGTIGDLEQLLIVNETSEQQLAMLASFVCDAYCPTCIDIKAFLNYDGTCSANIWQKATCFHRRREPSNRTLYVSISKPAYGPYASLDMNTYSVMFDGSRRRWKHTGQYHTRGVLRSVT